MTGYGGQFEHMIPAERLVNPTPERFDVATFLAAMRPPWMAEAACTGPGAPDFFPGPHDDQRPAKALCAVCPMQQTCLEYAFADGLTHGIWGGLNETERQRIRKAARTLSPITNHGTQAGYQAHRRRGEDACSECRAAWSRRSADQRSARRMAVAS